MATDYIVQQGDHFARIAERFGFLTVWPIWDHPKNRPLRDLRGTPNVLLPGDVVHVPDRVDKIVGCLTGIPHVFQVRTTRVLLRVILLDHRFQPMPGVSCEIDVAGAETQRTDVDGAISKEIPVTADSGRLIIGEHIFPIRVGHLDPVSAVSGVEARLNALGYETGNTWDATSPQFRSAIEEFQCDVGLEVLGELDAATLATLVELHGS